MTSIFQIVDLTKSYTLDSTHKEQVLKGISLAVAEGKITAIYGPSGCGKTSLLNIISGLDSQYEGQISFKGEDIRNFSEKTRTLYRREHIGFVFQNFNLVPHQSVLENVKLPLYIQGLTKKQMDEIAQRELSRLGMEQFSLRNVKQLSGGQKQRVAIARALVNQPEVIVADEPTGSLDSQAQDNVLRVFQDLKGEGKTVIIVTHNPEVADYADVIIKMKDGEVIETVKK